MSLISKAEAVARLVHRGQTRRDGRPYITHCSRVADAIRDKYGDEVLVAAAYLHDTLEDTPLIPQDLRDLEFPESVISIVKTLTRGPREAYSNYIQRVKISGRAKLIKIADLKDNLRDNSNENQVARYTKALKTLRT